MMNRPLRSLFKSGCSGDCDKAARAQQERRAQIQKHMRPAINLLKFGVPKPRKKT